MGEGVEYMRYLSVCSGIEAASVAWHDFGWTPVGFSEIEAFPSRVLDKRFPDVRNFGDMTKYKEWGLDGSTIDLLVGGTPCQSFSIAGLRKGLEDPRGNLALTFVAMVDHLKPEWVIWENVPGVLSSNRGRDFASLLTALGYIGYGWAYRVLDAQYFGVPQRRRRVFVVAHSSGDAGRAAEILFERESLRRNTPKSRAKGKNTTRGSASSVDSSGIPKTVGTICADTHPGAYSGQDAYTGRLIPVLYQSNQTDARLKEEPHTSQTVLARWGTGGGNTPLVQHTLHNSEHPQSDTGNIVMSAIPIQDCRPINKAQNGLGIGNDGDPSYTLDKMATQGVACEVANTLRANPGSGFRSDGTPVESLVYVQKAEAFNHQSGGDMRGIDPRPTAQLQVHQETSVLLECHMQVGSFKVGQSEKARSIGYSESLSPTLSANAGGNTVPGVHCEMLVRRLTPVECERLQGFPDGWTDISYYVCTRCKHTFDKSLGKYGCPNCDGSHPAKLVGEADSPRYKALGNSMAVPVMRWIGNRIRNVANND